MRREPSYRLDSGSSVPVAVLARLLRHRRVTLNTVYGALTAYFLIGLAWGFMYDTIQEIDAGSFAFPGPPQESYTDELLYFSLVTQTTLGFGDVTPVQAIPRTMAAVQAVAGQFYLVVLVARLVALQLTQPREGADPPKEMGQEIGDHNHGKDAEV